MSQPRYQERACILATLLIVWMWSCTATPPADDFERDLRSAEELTVPQGVERVEHPTPGVQRNMVVRRTWTFTTAVTWDDYQRWVTEQLRTRGRFELKSTADTALDFTRRQPGDLYRLHIERGRSGPPLDVHVAFTAMPD